MQLGHFEGFGGQVDAQNLRAFARHGIGQNTTTAAHIQHFLPRQGGQAIDPRQAQGVDLVQGAKFAFRVPPTVRQVRELGQFSGVDIVCRGAHNLYFRR